MATGNTGLMSAPSERPRITAALVSLDAEAKATWGQKAARRWPETCIFANDRRPTGETETCGRHIVVRTGKGGHAMRGACSMKSLWCLGERVCSTTCSRWLVFRRNRFCASSCAADTCPPAHALAPDEAIFPAREGSHSRKYPQFSPYHMPWNMKGGHYVQLRFRRFHNFRYKKIKIESEPSCPSHGANVSHAPRIHSVGCFCCLTTLGAIYKMSGEGTSMENTQIGGLDRGNLRPNAP